jgi:predicted Ser/Thr protein kinase
MQTSVNETSHCPSCGKPVPANTLAGLCPACLLAQGSETETAAVDPAPRFTPLPIAEVAKIFPALEVLELLGSGGMGAVYKARQPALDRMVALKLLSPSDADGAKFGDRFNREARALARLSHPNIVAVHEFGQTNGLPFFIMEFVDGANLRQLERAGRLSPREALQIIPQICDALQYAHDEGVVHRDIKPENVLVDRRGRVKIADFGLAKILGQDAESLRLTREGQVMGTPHYMAPEQVEKPLTVDHRADIYSLGVVFYEMLTGDLPLGKFAPPSRKVEVDVRLDEVVLRALENDPERRYQQASEVKSRVETIAGTPATPITPVENEPRYLGFLGFAVVSEIKGTRTVAWRRTLAVFALTFGLLTLAFGLVTAYTGESLFGWIGIKGWPSVIARLIIAAVAVGLGVRHALRSRHLPEALPKTPEGTLILPSAARAWWIARHLILASLLGLAWGMVDGNKVMLKLLSKLDERRPPQARSVKQLLGTGDTRQPSTGGVGQAYGPVIELTFSELLDLDTGKTAGFPKSKDPGALVPDLGWMQEQGFDAAAGPGKLDLLGVTIVNLMAEDWDSMVPARLIERLDTAGKFVGEFQSSEDASTRPTFGFRTREGGVGILQPARVNGPNVGMTVRYKLAQSSVNKIAGANWIYGNPPQQPAPSANSLRFAPLEIRAVHQGIETAGSTGTQDQNGRPIRVGRELLMDGSAIESAGWSNDPVSGRDQIDLKLSQAGRVRFAEVTARFIHRQLAILIDGKVASTPFVNERIDSPNFNLTAPPGGEAQFAALLLKLNPQRPELAQARFGAEHEVTMPFAKADGQRTYLNLQRATLISDHPRDTSAREFHEWRRRVGASLAVMATDELRLPVLVAHDCTVMNAGTNSWNDAAPVRVLLNSTLISQEPKKEFVFGPDLTKNTFYFRTGTDEWGIIKIAGLAPDGAGVTVRYKSVETAKSDPHRVLLQEEPADLREARATLAELQTQYAPEHPRVKEASARLGELKRMASQEPDAPADLRKAKARLAELRVSFSEEHPLIQQALARIKVLEGK